MEREKLEIAILVRVITFFTNIIWYFRVKTLQSSSTTSSTVPFFFLGGGGRLEMLINLYTRSPANAIEEEHNGTASVYLSPLKFQTWYTTGSEPHGATKDHHHKAHVQLVKPRVAKKKIQWFETQPTQIQ